MKVLTSWGWAEPNSVQLKLGLNLRLNFSKLLSWIYWWNDPWLIEFIKIIIIIKNVNLDRVMTLIKVINFVKLIYLISLLSFVCCTFITAMKFSKIIYFSRDIRFHNVMNLCLCISSKNLIFTKLHNLIKTWIFFMIMDDKFHEFDIFHQG